MKEELERGFVDLGSLARLYAEAKKAGLEDVSSYVQEAADAVAMSNAEAVYATTLAAFADEATNGIR